MSKRKREDEGEAEKMEEEENSSPKTTNGPTSRNQMYEEVCQEIRKCQETIKVARHKLVQLNDNVDDFLCMNGMACIDEAYNQMEDALTSLEQSRRHRISFLDIPEDPMRHILKYLSFEDKANFRLASEANREIVDSLDDDFKTVKITRWDRWELDELYETKKYIKLKLVGRLDNLRIEEEEAFYHESERIIEVAGPPEIMDYISSYNKVENLYLKLDYGYSQSQHSLGWFREPASNLKVLHLRNINISGLKEQIISLPSLEKLKLFNVRGFDGFIKLLTSCSASLQEISLTYTCTMDEDWNLASLNNIVLTRLKKMEISNFKGHVSGILSLLKIASSSLKVLVLEEQSLTSMGTIPPQPDLSFPNLEKFHMIRCNSDLVSSLLACSAPSLASVTLESTELNHSTDIRLHSLQGITKLEIISCGDFNKVLEAAAATVEELHLNCHNEPSVDITINSFPMLKRVHFNDCKSQVTAGIMSRSPRIQQLGIQNYDEDLEGGLDGVDLGGIEKLMIRKRDGKELSARQIKSLLSRFSEDRLQELAIFGIKFPVHHPVKPMKLTKLSLHGSSSATGLCGLLNACRSTLEELEIWNCFSYEPVSVQGLQDMTALKKITVHVPCYSMYENIFRPEGLNELLEKSSKSLEKLVLFLPCNTDDANKKYVDTLMNNNLLTLDLSLPNLKILQVHPRPADKVLRKMKRQVSNDVTLWFFPPHEDQKLIQYHY